MNLAPWLPTLFALGVVSMTVCPGPSLKVVHESEQRRGDLPDRSDCCLAVRLSRYCAGPTGVVLTRDPVQHYAGCKCNGEHHVDSALFTAHGNDPVVDPAEPLFCLGSWMAVTRPRGCSPGSRPVSILSRSSGRKAVGWQCDGNARRWAKRRKSPYGGIAHYLRIPRPELKDIKALFGCVAGEDCRRCGRAGWRSQPVCRPATGRLR